METRIIKIRLWNSDCTIPQKEGQIEFPKNKENPRFISLLGQVYVLSNNKLSTPTSGFVDYYQAKVFVLDGNLNSIPT